MSWVVIDKNVAPEQPQPPRSRTITDLIPLFKPEEEGM